MLRRGEPNASSHLRVLEDARLLELVETRQRRGCTAARFDEPGGRPYRVVVGDHPAARGARP